MKKSELLDLLRDEPEELDLDKLLYTLWFRQRLERALAEEDDDEGMPHEQFVAEIKQWRA